MQLQRAAGALRILAVNRKNFAAMKDQGYGKKSLFGWKIP